VYEVDNVLMLLAASLDMKVSDRVMCTKAMIKGFDDLCKEAGTTVTGGQTVYNPWPIIGGVAKSIVRLSDVIMPRHAVAGDVIVLTKPLGTQVAVNVRQWMSDEKKWKAVESVITRAEAVRAYNVAQASMVRLNRNGARLMHKYGAHAATDVTGFGILGHANNLASNQLAAVSLVIHTLPVISLMKTVADAVPIFKLVEGFSAETSGGLFICMPRSGAQAFIQELNDLDGWPAWIIGDVVSGAKEARISPSVRIVDV